MAGIDTGGHGGPKKSVNQELPLIPFIDFLLCCVMFLLVTAVWNQLARLETSQVAPGRVDTFQDTEPPESRTLVVGRAGYELRVGDGPAQAIARAAAGYDRATLMARLDGLQRADPRRHDLVIEAEDGVAYVDVVEAMDATARSGLVDFSLSPLRSTH